MLITLQIYIIIYNNNFITYNYFTEKTQLQLIILNITYQMPQQIMLLPILLILKSLVHKKSKSNIWNFVIFQCFQDVYEPVTLLYIKL